MGVNSERVDQAVTCLVSDCFGMMDSVREYIILIQGRVLFYFVWKSVRSAI